MRLGAHAFLWCQESAPEALILAIRQAAEAKLDFIEIPLLRLEEMKPDTLRLALQRYGLPCTCSVVLPCEASLPQNPRGAEEFLVQAVDAAARLGSPVLTGVVYSTLGEDSPPRLDTLHQVIAVLKRVAQAAAARGLRLGIEPVNRYETSLINTAEQALEIMEALAEPNVFLHLDTYHMNIEEQGFRSPILKAGKRLGYIHLSESHRGVPGTGNVRWEEVFSALAQIGFAGDLAVEAFLAPSPSLARATRIWRPLSLDPQQVVHSAHTFFRTVAGKYGLVPRPEA